MEFTNAAELLALCEKEEIGLGEAMLRRETALTGAGREEIREGIVQLSSQVAARLRKCGMKCQGVSLAIRDPNFQNVSRQTRLDTPTSLTREVTRAAMDLADSFWNMSSPVRAITVTAIYLVPASEVGAQMDLFFPERELKRQRLERLEDKLDAIEAKYRRKNPSKTV